MPYKTSSDKEENYTNLVMLGVCMIILSSMGMFLGFEYATVRFDKTHQVDPCEDAIFQRTLLFKLNDWEVRARKKLGDQWSCYEVGEAERQKYFYGTPKIRVLFVLKKKGEGMK